MQVIALPGRHRTTEAWMRTVLGGAMLATNGIAHYRHWDAAVEADAEWESRRLLDATPDLVVAKSLGTVIASRAFVHHRFRPRNAVLIGTPFDALGPGELAVMRQFASGVETLFIQQDEDPGGPASQLATALGVARGAVVAVPGSDHLYTDTAALAAIIRRWAQRSPQVS